MINRLEIRHWQSLVKADLALGQLTAIVGPSSSGKSALMRGLRALASNTRGSGSITSGAKTTVITAYTDTHKITWQRSTNDGGRYILADLAAGKEDTYTKLAGTVPPAITAALHIAPAPTSGSSINIAGQFEGPFLLTESGAAVARLLGQLANVSTILAAVQEANRRRLALQQTLKVREADLADKLARAQEFRTLRARLEARTRAEGRADEADRLLRRISQLRSHLDNLVVAESVLARAVQRPAVPDDSDLHTAAARLSDFKRRIRDWAGFNNAAASAAEHAAKLEREETEAQVALDEALAAAGYCPTCGQRVPSFTRAARDLFPPETLSRS